MLTPSAKNVRVTANRTWNTWNGWTNRQPPPWWPSLPEEQPFSDTSYCSTAGRWIHKQQYNNNNKYYSKKGYMMLVCVSRGRSGSSWCQMAGAKGGLFLKETRGNSTDSSSAFLSLCLCLAWESSNGLQALQALMPLSPVSEA